MTRQAGPLNDEPNHDHPDDVGHAAATPARPIDARQMHHSASRLNIHFDTLRHTSQLADYFDWENVSATRNAQDDRIATRILEYSASNIPPSLIESHILDGYIGNAIDLRPYAAKDGSIRLSKLEDGTGLWGGLLRTPTPQISLISEILRRLGKTLSAIESPVVLLAAASGPLHHTGIPNCLASPGIGEKIWVADQIANGFRLEGRQPHVVGFQETQWLKRKNEINYLHGKNPTVIVGHFNQLNNAKSDHGSINPLINIVNGQVLFSDRPVDCIINDRFAHYIQERHGYIDPQKTCIGPLVDLGKNRAFSYAAHNAFVEQPGVREQFPALAHEIAYTRCQSVDALIEAAHAFGDRGRGFVCKPTGTVGGHGVIVVKPGAFEPHHFPLLVQRALAEVGWIYNRQGTVAGMPQHASHILTRAGSNHASTRGLGAFRKFR